MTSISPIRTILPGGCLPPHGPRTTLMSAPVVEPCWGLDPKLNPAGRMILEAGKAAQAVGVKVEGGAR